MTTITVHKNMGKGVFFNTRKDTMLTFVKDINYTCTAILGQKRGTFFIPLKCDPNMGISHNLQNDRGKWRSESERYLPWFVVGSANYIREEIF